MVGEGEQVSMLACFLVLRLLSSTPSPHSGEYVFPGEVCRSVPEKISSRMSKLTCPPVPIPDQFGDHQLCTRQRYFPENGLMCASFTRNKNFKGPG